LGENFWPGVVSKGKKRLTTEDTEGTEKIKEAGDEPENRRYHRVSHFISLLCVLRVLCGSNFVKNIAYLRA
jgi:hypothetical protein